MQKAGENKNYIRYLSSDEWKQKHEERLKIDNRVCQGCGSRGTVKNPLQIHHLHYHTVGNENVYKELVTVCRSCHGIVHGILNRVIDSQGTRGWSETLPISTVWQYMDGEVYTEPTKG